MTPRWLIDVLDPDDEFIRDVEVEAENEDDALETADALGCLSYHQHFGDPVRIEGGAGE